MNWTISAALPGQGVAIRYSDPGQPEGVFVLPVLAWRIDDSGFAEAIVATQDTAESESDISKVTNWEILGYHIPPYMPHPEVAK